MKLDCEIIRDLLPLYGDNVCSEKSREAVEEHLRECETCREELKALGENNIPALLRAEGGTPVIGAYRRMLKNKILFFLVCVFVFPLINGIFAALYGEAVWETALFTLLSALTFIYIPAAARKKRFVMITASSVLTPVILMWSAGIFHQIEYYPKFAEEYGWEEAMFVIILTVLIPAGFIALLSAGMFAANIRSKPTEPSQYGKLALKAAITETCCLFYCGYMSTLMSMAEDSDYIIKGTAGVIFPVICHWGAFLIFRFCKKNIFIRLGLYCIVLGIFASNWAPLLGVISSSGFSGIYWHYFPWLPILTVSFAAAVIFFVIGVIWEKSKFIPK